MKNKFVARKWSDSPLQSEQFDIVYLDFANNNQHFFPDVKFTLEENAIKVAEAMNSFITDEGEHNAKQWPIDGAIPEQYL